MAEAESGEALEGLAEALYLEREYAEAAASYERAYAAYRRERRSMAAGRAARAVAWITGNVPGDWAVQSGWIARAGTILEEAGTDGPERGWVLILRAYAEPDVPAREALLGQAVDIGRRFGDPDVEFEALSHLGCVHVMSGRVEQGLVLLDEAPFEAAMADYQSTRDRQVLPMYELTCELATLEPPPPELQQLLGAAHGNQEAMDAFARMMAGVTSPAEFFSEQNVGRILANA